MFPLNKYYKYDLKGNDMGIDENFDMEDFDDLDSALDGGIKSGDGDRSPTVGALSDGAEGFVEHFTSAENVEERLKKVSSTALKGVVGEQAGDVLETGIGDFKDELENSVDEVKKELAPITRSLKQIAPKDGVLGDISQKLLGFVSTGSGSSNRELSDEEKMNNRVMSAMGSLGSLNTSAEANKEELSKEIMKFNQMNSQLNLLQAVAAHTSLLSKFAINNTTAFYKKQLELQYKQVFLTTDIKSILASGFDRLAKENNIIAKNTGLPDFVKTRSMEALHANMRSKFNDKVTDSLFGGNSWVDNVRSNIIGRVKDTTKNIKGYVSQAADLNDERENLMESLRDGEEAGMSMGNTAGSEVAGIAENQANNALLKLLRDNPKLSAFVKKSNRILSGGVEQLNKVSEENKGNIIGSVAAYFRDLGRDPAKDIATSIQEVGLDDNVLFDNRTRLSIIKVIPSLLSKILSSVEKFRTGGKSSELRYNFKTDRFESADDVDVKIIDDIKTKTYNDGTTYKLKSFVDKITYNTKPKLTGKEKKILISKLYSYITTHDSLNPEFLEQNGFYRMFDKDLGKKVRKLIMKYLNGDDGEVDADNLDALYSTLRDSKSSIKDPTSMFKEYKDSGNIEALEKQGLAKYNKVTGEYQIDTKRYHELVSGLIGETSSKKFERAFTSGGIDTSSAKVTSLKDVYDSAKSDYEKLDKKKLKKKAIVKAKRAGRDILKKAKDLDETVANMTKDDFIDMGAKTKKEAIERIEKTYKDNISLETREKIDKKLNEIYDSKGYEFTERKIKETYDYAKNLDKEKLSKDMAYINRKFTIRKNRLTKLIKTTSKGDLEKLGLDSRDKAFKYFSDLYGKHDIATLKRIEKEVGGLYDKIDKADADNFVKSLKDGAMGRKDRIIKQSKGRYSSIKNYVSRLKIKDLEALRLDTVEEAMTFFIKKYPELTNKDKKNLYKDLSKIYALKKKKEDAKNVGNSIFGYVGGMFKSKDKKNKKTFFDSDGDGKRNGSWQEQIENKKPKAKKTKKEKEEKPKEEKGGILGMILAALTGGMSMVGGLMGNILGSVKGTTSILGVLSSMVGGIVKGLGFAPIKGAWWTAKLAGTAAWEIAKASFTGAMGTARVVKGVATGATTVGGALLKGGDKVIDGAKGLFSMNGLKKLGKFGFLGAVLYGFSQLTNGNLLEGTMSMITGLASLIPGVGPLLSAGLSLLPIGNGEKKETTLEEDEMIADAYDAGVMTFVDTSEFEPVYRNAIEKLNVEIALLHVKMEDSVSSSRRKIYEKRLNKLKKQRSELITNAKRVLKTNRDDDKRVMEEEKKKTAALEGERSIILEKVKTSNQRLITLKGAMKDATTEEEKKALTTEITLATKERKTALDEYIAFGKNKPVGSANTPVKTPGTTMPVTGKSDISKISGPVETVEGTTKVLKGVAEVAGYIIRTVETNNRYGAANIVKGENFVSFGAYQFTEKSGSLYKVLKTLKNLGPTYKDNLNEIMAKFNNGRYYSGSKTELMTFLKQIGNDINCKKAQDLTFYEMYYKPAEREYKKLGVDSKHLMVHLVDHYHNRGNVKNFVTLFKTSNDIIGSRLGDYKALKNWAKYGNGWTNRVNRVESMATKYLGANTLPQDADGETRNVEGTKSTSGSSKGGIASGLSMAISGILSFFGLGGDDNKPDVMADGSKPVPGIVPGGKTSTKLEHNNAGITNPLIHDWKTEKRYKSINAEAKTFFSKFSHYAAQNGLKLQIPRLGGNRSQKNQDDLYAQGRNGNPGKIVTWTRKSKHIGGRAIDIISLDGYGDTKGNLAIAKLMRAFAEENPDLGARFLKISKDPNHVQFDKSGAIAPYDVEAEIKGSTGDDKAVEEEYQKRLKNNQVTETYGLPSKAGIPIQNKFTKTVSGSSATALRDATRPSHGSTSSEPDVTTQTTVKNGIGKKQKAITPTVIDATDRYSKDRLGVLKDLHAELKKMNELNAKMLDVSQENLSLTEVQVEKLDNVKQTETRVRKERIQQHNPVIPATR